MKKIRDMGPKMHPRYWVGELGYDTLPKAEKAAGIKKPAAHSPFPSKKSVKLPGMMGRIQKASDEFVESCACPDHWDGKPAAPQSSPLPHLEARESSIVAHHVHADGSDCFLAPSEHWNSSDKKRHEDFFALIVRRVNQGPAFDALLEAAEHFKECPHHDPANFKDCWNAESALKLAQEAK